MDGEVLLVLFLRPSICKNDAYDTCYNQELSRKTYKIWWRVKH